MKGCLISSKEWAPLDVNCHLKNLSLAENSMPQCNTSDKVATYPTKLSKVAMPQCEVMPYFMIHYNPNNL